MAAHSPSSDGRRIAVCARNPSGKPGGKEQNIPMAATLQEIPLAPDTQPKVLTDCYTLIEQQISDNSGDSGTAVKLAYKTMNTFMPRHTPSMVGPLLPHILRYLAPCSPDFIA